MLYPLQTPKIPSTARIVGQQIPLTRGLHVVYIKAPSGDSNWAKFLSWVAKWSRSWDGFLIFQGKPMLGVAPALEAEWNLKKQAGLTLRMPKPGEFFRIKLDGKTVTVPRKGYDEKKKALFFVLELK